MAKSQSLPLCYDIVAGIGHLQHSITEPDLSCTQHILCQDMQSWKWSTKAERRPPVLLESRRLRFGLLPSYGVYISSSWYGVCMASQRAHAGSSITEMYTVRASMVPTFEFSTFLSSLDLSFRVGHLPRHRISRRRDQSAFF